MKNDFGGHDNYHTDNLYAQIGEAIGFYDAPMLDGNLDFGLNSPIFSDLCTHFRRYGTVCPTYLLTSCPCSLHADSSLPSDAMPALRPQATRTCSPAIR